MSNRVGAVAAAAVAVLVLTGFGPPPDPDSFTDAEIAKSVSNLDLNVDKLTLNITEVAQKDRDGDEDVITLSSDILFAFGKATLSDRAKARIAELVKDVPKKARLQVYGHTDSVGSASSNQKLSEARAKAVADVVRKARSDLKLTVKGFGESRPVASNGSPGKDNPEGRAKNRRVELRYKA